MTIIMGIISLWFWYINNKYKNNNNSTNEIILNINKKINGIQFKKYNQIKKYNKILIGQIINIKL